MNWSHDDLARDLAQHLLRDDRMVWTDMQLGPSGSQRPDVYVVKKSYARPHAVTYEVKVSMADFRADTTAGKWHGYLDMSCGVYFAAPSGLLTRNHIPDGCGLIVRGDAGWRTLRAPTMKPWQPDWFLLMKLLIDGEESRQRPAARRERTTWGAMEKIAARWGEDVASDLADLQAARWRVDAARSDLERQRKELEEQRAGFRKEMDAHRERVTADVCRSLGLPSGTPDGELREMCATLRAAVRGDGRYKRDHLSDAEHALEGELKRVAELRKLIAWAQNGDER